MILRRNRKETQPKSQVYTLHRHSNTILILYYTCFYIIFNFIFWRGLDIFRYIFLSASILNLYLVHSFLNFAISTFYFFYFT